MNFASPENSKYTYSLLAPGPVNLHPKVREVLAQPMIHHRTPEFDQILKQTLAGIKKVFQTEQNVYLLSSTGSGGMEALLVNLLSKNEKVVAVNAGKFGERWAEMARTFGAEVIEHKVPWGESCKPEDLKNLLFKHPDTRLVLCQACETSTGVAQPIKELSATVHSSSNALFLVDAITALGAYNLPMDEWGLDGVVAGSQKAFMLPTGLSLISFSKRAAEKFETANCPRYYFDIRKELKANSNGETFFSSNVSLIKALSVVLNLIETQGLQNHFAEISKRAKFTRDFSQLLGFSLFAKDPSDSLTALTVPKGIDGQKLRSHLEQNYILTVMGGQDQAKGKIIRIGHMGYITPQEMVHLISALAHSLNDLQPGLVPDKDLQDVLQKAKTFWGLT